MFVPIFSSFPFLFPTFLTFGLFDLFPTFSTFGLCLSVFVVACALVDNDLVNAHQNDYLFRTGINLMFLSHKKC